MLGFAPAEVMDVIFNCPNCQQELSVDGAGSGTQIECPTCKTPIVVPAPTPEEAGGPPAAPAPQGQPQAAHGAPPAHPPPAGQEAPRDFTHPVNPMATSAASKTERHFSVPIHDTPSESLITKPLPTLEVSAKDTTKRMRVKSIKRSDCVEVGKDRFDEIVTDFLGKVGEENVTNVTTFNYTHMDLATRDWVTDYGVLIVYKG